MKDRVLRDAVYYYAEMRLTGVPQCHDFSHTLRVCRNAERIAASEHPDHPLAVELGALLHDIARPEELASGGRTDHAALGGELVPGILRSFDCTDEALIAHVAAIVRTHRYRSGAAPETLEAKIVYDADKLDSLGAFGVARAFHFAGRVGACLHNSAEVALASPAYSDQDSAYREYLVKLRYLPDKMLTDTGRVLARERAKFMNDFFDRLLAEESGGDQYSTITTKQH